MIVRGEGEDFFCCLYIRNGKLETSWRSRQTTIKERKRNIALYGNLVTYIRHKGLPRVLFFRRGISNNNWLRFSEKQILGLGAL